MESVQSRLGDQVIQLIKNKCVKKHLQLKSFSWQFSLFLFLQVTMVTMLARPWLNFGGTSN